MQNPLRKYIQKVLWEHYADLTCLEKNVLDTLRKAQSEANELGYRMISHDSKIRELREQLTGIKNEIDTLFDSSRLADMQSNIDQYVEQSVRSVISQGSKCSTKLSNKEESFENKVIVAQGKIKRELPVIKERLNIIEEKLDVLEKISN
jgi:predicted  nucleic acid-binding Zn-ribbon protein